MKICKKTDREEKSGQVTKSSVGRGGEQPEEGSVLHIKFFFVGFFCPGRCLRDPGADYHKENLPSHANLNSP